MLKIKDNVDLKELEKERCRLRNSNELLENAIHTLQDRNKEIYEGFMATTQELCEATKEIERLNNIINKVIANIEDVRDKNNYYDDYKVDNSILTYWIDLLKGSDKE